MIVNGLGSRGWSLILSGSAVLYGVVGWIGLGVTIDAVLFVGAITLALTAVFHVRQDQAERTNIAKAPRLR